MRRCCEMLPKHQNQFFKPHSHRCVKNDRTTDFHVSKNDGKSVTPQYQSKPIETRHIYDVKATTEEDSVKHRDLMCGPRPNSESYGWWYENANVAKEIESCHDWYPSLSSESYGWWYDGAFSLRQSGCNHRVRDPTLVHTTEVIHWQDQKLFGLGHSSYANNA